MTERLKMGQSYQPVLKLLNNKTCINPILVLYYNLLGLYFVFVVDGRKGGLVGKRAFESISRRQFSNRIDLNAIVARRHTGILKEHSFQFTNNPAQRTTGNLKEAKMHEKFDLTTAPFVGDDILNY